MLRRPNQCLAKIFQKDPLQGLGQQILTLGGAYRQGSFWFLFILTSLCAEDPPKTAQELLDESISHEVAGQEVSMEDPSPQKPACGYLNTKFFREHRFSLFSGVLTNTIQKLCSQGRAIARWQAAPGNTPESFPRTTAGLMCLGPARVGRCNLR